MCDHELLALAPEAEEGGLSRSSGFDPKDGLMPGTSLRTFGNQQEATQQCAESKASTFDSAPMRLSVANLLLVASRALNPWPDMR